MSLLEIKNLNIHYLSNKGGRSALKNVSFQLNEGEVLCITGESGCGKTSLGLGIMGLLPERTKIRGQIMYRGTDLLTLKNRSLQNIRGSEISMIFEQPVQCLNPVLKSGEQIAESVLAHEKCSRKKAKEKAVDLMCQVGIPSPEKRFYQYPHELSGGMAQRVMIAMALASGPSLLIADEPTTSVDVTIQAQIIRLLKDVIETHHMSLLLITHDLGAAFQMADQVAVMYSGRIVEIGPAAKIFSSPGHAYTQSLVDAAFSEYPGCIN